MNDPRAIKRLQLTCGTVLGVAAAYWAAAIAGVPDGVLSAVFTVMVAVLVTLAWWAVSRAPTELRLFAWLAALGVTLQVVGTTLWYIAFLGAGEVPEPPGYWSPVLWVASAVGVAAAWAAVRGALSLREAALDYSLVVAATAAVAVATVSYRLEPGVTTATIDTAARPIGGLLIVTLIVSAVLGRWRALPLPVGIFAVAMLFNATADVMFGWLSAQEEYSTNRWTGAIWFTGVMIAMLAAAAVILRVERPIRLSRAALPAVSAWVLMASAVAAWTVAGGVTLYGALADVSGALWAGMAAGVWIGIAVSLRTLSALEESRSAYRRLDEAHLELEQVAAQRDETIDTLARRSVEHQATQAMLGSLLDLADDRTDGELRAHLEETADDLVDWLPRRGE